MNYFDVFDIVNNVVINIFRYVFCIFVKFFLVGIYLRECIIVVFSVKFLFKVLYVRTFMGNIR